MPNLPWPRRSTIMLEMNRAAPGARLAGGIWRDFAVHLVTHMEPFLSMAH
jgi:hypothetical protein